MKLEGSLDAFGLPDIFQLLSHTKKTGGLHLRRGGADGVVYFEDGAVCGASADERQQTLARRLVGSGTVDDDALRSAVQRAVNDQVGIGRALLDSNAVDPELLREAATEQTFDAVFDLMCWTEGDFAFAGDESDPDGVGLRLPADKVVEEAQTRREAWDAAASGVPSPDTVLAMPVVLDADPALTRDEWALLALVDGRRPVREIVELTGAGQFAVVSTLSRLVERGLLGVRDDAHDHAAVVARRLALLSPLEREGNRPNGNESDAGGAEEPAAEEPEPARVPPPPAGAGELHIAVASDSDSVSASAPVEVSVVEPELTVESDHGSQPEGARIAMQNIVTPPGERPNAGGTHDYGPRPGGAAYQDNVAREIDPISIERDPNVNRSLLLRLIAGVRGL